MPVSFPPGNGLGAGLLFLTAQACVLTPLNLSEAETGDTSIENDSNDLVHSDVQLMHLIAGIGPIDVFLDERNPPVMEALTAGTVTPLTQVLSGNHSIQFARANTGLNDVFHEVSDVQLWESLAYIGVTFGTPEDVSCLFFQAQPQNLESGKTRFTVVHTHPFWEDIDLWTIQPQSAVLQSGLPYGDTTTLDVKSHAMIVGIDTNRDGEVDTVFDMPAQPSDTGILVYLQDVDSQPHLMLHHADGQLHALAGRPPS